MGLLTLLVLVQPAASQASTDLPDGFFEVLVASGIEDATALQQLPNGRLLVAQKFGDITLISGDGAASPVLTLDVNAEGERGVVGLALDPDFDDNGHFYVVYTRNTPSVFNRVSRFTLTDDTVEPSSEQVLFDLPEQTASYHVGGGIAFGIDGKLYVGVGENTLYLESQSLDSLRGKVLRLNRDGSIPDDNPLIEVTQGPAQAIWAYGLRNPFTIATSRTGVIVINDTGETAFEEINLGVAGGNYGWPDVEGYTDDPRYISPIHAYPHGTAEGEGCAIDGGTFYEPAVEAFPLPYVGMYFFIDYCATDIRILDVSTGEVNTFATGVAAAESGISQLVGLHAGSDGALYWIARDGGQVYRATYTGLDGPFIGQHPQSRAVPVGERATFEVRASGSGVLTYQWQEDGQDIDEATDPTLNIWQVLPDHEGSVFECVVRSEYGEVRSEAAQLSALLPSVTYEADAGEWWEPEKTITYPIQLHNDGSSTWQAEGRFPVELAVSVVGVAHELLVDWESAARFSLPGDVAPGESVAIRVTLAAPADPGTYALQHRLVMDGITWFEEIDRSEITVRGSLVEHLPLVMLVAVTGLGIGLFAWSFLQRLRRSSARRRAASS